MKERGEENGEKNKRRGEEGVGGAERIFILGSYAASLCLSRGQSGDGILG